jgi:hypothetical protein
LRNGYQVWKVNVAFQRINIDGNQSSERWYFIACRADSSYSEYHGSPWAGHSQLAGNPRNLSVIWKPSALFWYKVGRRSVDGDARAGRVTVAWF